MPQVRITANIGGSKVRKEMLEGRPHTVVDGVILTEAVLDGNEGPILYPDEENSKDPTLWDGMPMVVYHPKENGEFISAQQPHVYDTRRVGTIFNSAYADKKVKPEFWFDDERTAQIDARIMTMLEEEKPIEVSTGLKMDVESKEGELNGVKYKGVAHNYKPNHVAILPDKIGALSVAMGGGIFANMAKEPESTQTVFLESLKRHLALVGVTITANELSYDDVTRMLCDALASKYGEKGKYWKGYVCEVFPDHVVFCTGYDSGKCFDQKYTVSDTGVELTGDAVEVVRSVEYKPVTSAGEKSVNNQEKEKEMAFDKKAHITGLIGNGFEEADREWLEGLPDDRLQKIKATPKVTVNTSPPPASPPPAPNPTPVLVTNEDWRKTVPSNVLQSIDRQLARDKQHKDGLITHIVANSKFAKDFLETKDIPELEALAELASRQKQDDATNGGMFQDGYQPQSFFGANGYTPVVNQKDLDAPVVPLDYDEEKAA